MRQRIVLLSVALLLALVGTGAIVTYVAGADQRALAGTQAVDVLIATSEIPAGTPLATVRAQGMVATQRFPRTTVPPDALTALEGTAPGAVTTRAVGVREILVSSTFGADTAGSANTAAGITLPPGTSAVPVSMKVFDNSADWSAYFTPGSEIALYETFISLSAQPFVPSGLDAGSPGTTNVTRVVLDRVKVVSVGNGVASAGSDSSSGSSSKDGGGAVVLALTQTQTEKLLLGLGIDKSKVKLYPVLLAPGSRVAPSAGTAVQQQFDATAPAAPATPTTPTTGGPRP